MLTVTTLDEFPTGPAGETWESVVAADPAATVFHSARFLRLWCRHLRGKCDLKLRIVREGGDVVGVIPEVREREGDAAGEHAEAGPSGGRLVGHFAGGYHVTDYLGPVSPPDRRAEVVDAWLRVLADEEDWDAFLAGGLAEDAGWHDLIARRGRALGLEVDGPDVEDVCPRIELTGGWEAYLSRISGKQRHEIRRKARKLAREVGTVKLVEEEPEEAEAAIERFVEMARESGGDKGRFFEDEDKRRFFHALAEEFAVDGTLRIHRLDIDGAPAAITVSLVHAVGDGAEWGLYNSAFDHRLGGIAPGMVLVGELIRIAAEEGCDTFDLLRGDEPYKYRFGAVDRRVHRLVLGRKPVP